MVDGGTNYYTIVVMSSPSSYVMYLVLRRDLMTSLGWPMGAVCTQAAHAASAAMWLFRCVAISASQLR